MHGATEYHIDIMMKDAAAEFTVKAYPADLSEEEMEQLQKKLNAPRHKEIEQDYWALMGESEDFSEMTLVGMMSDKASAKCSDQILTLRIERHD
jgi:hypothetical protein